MPARPASPSPVQSPWNLPPLSILKPFLVLAVVCVPFVLWEGFSRPRDHQQWHQKMVNLAPVWGERKAPIQVFEFNDFQCTYCNLERQMVFEKLRPLVQSGQVAVFFINTSSKARSSVPGIQYQACIAKLEPARVRPFVDQAFAARPEFWNTGTFRQVYAAAGGARWDRLQQCVQQQGNPDYVHQHTRYLNKMGSRELTFDQPLFAIGPHVMQNTRELFRVLEETVQQGSVPSGLVAGGQTLY